MTESVVPRKKIRRSGPQASNASPIIIFKTGDDIRQAVTNQPSDTLKTSLQSLRNQLTIYLHEIPISSNDERLLLLQDWLTKSPGAPEIFEIWDSSQNTTHLSLCMSILAAMLTLLSQHYIYHSLADDVIHRILDQNVMRRLNSYLGTVQHEIMIGTLKLFNALVGFADGREKRSVLDNFSWSMKSLPKLFNMRRKGSRVAPKDALSNPDIRTLFILFILSYLSPSTPTPLKSVLLEEHKELFRGIFKGIMDDPYEVIRRVLEVSWDGVWCDHKLPRTVKIRLFGENCLAQLTKLYKRSEPEGDEGADVPADLVHHFLLAITTRPGTGLCFHDRGWYPRAEQAEALEGHGREIDEDVRKDQPSSGGVHNKILRNFIKTLKIGDDSRHQELLLKIFEACPELVQGYWSSASISLEPRLSPRWIANTAFLGSVVSLPVPTRCFTTSDRKMSSSSTSLTNTPYLSSPPPLSAILENTIPTAFSKEYLSKGLQSHKEPLVIHYTAIALVKIISKFEAVQKAFKVVEDALEETNENGLWRRRRVEAEAHVRRRVPEYQVIVALVQKYAPSSPLGGSDTPELSAEPSLHTLGLASTLTEVALRLMWLYHRSLSELVTETRFDAGKLLHYIPSPLVETSASLHEGTNLQSQLHILGLLEESGQFGWSSKFDSSHSHLYHIMMLRARSPSHHVREAAASLAATILARSILFEHDMSEPFTWLDALPAVKRSPDARAPDGTSLVDELTCVASFLDECISRCLKTPYHYLENILDMCYGSDSGLHASESNSSSRPPQFAPSPLLGTIFEQFVAKQNKHLLSPPETLAIVTYLRKALAGLVGKQPDVACTLRIHEVFCTLIRQTQIPTNASSITSGLGRELRFTRRVVSALRAEDRDPVVGYPIQRDRDAVTSFLDAIEGTDTGDVAELIDWMRLLDIPLTKEDLVRLAGAINRWAPDDGAALTEFVAQLEPSVAELSAIDSVHSRPEVLLNLSTISWAMLLSMPHCIENSSFRLNIARAICHHKMNASGLQSVRLFTLLAAKFLRNGEIPAIDAIFAFLTEVLEQAKGSNTDLVALKRLLFMEGRAIGEALRSDSVSSARSQFICKALDTNSAIDCALARDYCDFWSSRLPSLLARPEGSTSLLALVPWIPFFDESSLGKCLSIVLNPKQLEKWLATSNTTYAAFIDQLSTTIRSHQSRSVLAVVRPYLPAVIQFAGKIRSSTLTSLLESIMASHLPFGLHRVMSMSGGDEQLTLSRLARQALKRWRGRGDALPVVDLINLLGQGSISHGFQPDVWAALIYRSNAPTSKILPTLIDMCSRDSALLPVLYSALDGQDIANKTHVAELSSIIPQLIYSIPSESRALADRTNAAWCVLALYESYAELRESIASQTIELINTLPFEHLFRVPLQLFFSRLYSTSHDDPYLRSLMAQLVEHGLQLIVRQFSDQAGDSAESLNGLEVFSRVLENSVQIKPQLAEPVFAAGISNRLESHIVIRFLATLAKRVNFKPVISNRLIQRLLQHESFYVTTRPPSPPSTPPVARDAIVDLLSSLFAMNPANASQPSHIIPLARIYTGTLSWSVLQLRSIFEQFEAHRSLSIAPLFTHWTANKTGSPNNLLDALTSVDPALAMKTCTNFSSTATFDHLDTASGAKIYDPRFLISLLSGVLVKADSMNHLDWVNLFRTNVVSVALRALAAGEDDVRELAAQTLFVLGHSLKDADFQEREEVLLVLRMGRDAVPAMASPPHPDAASVARLSTLHSLLLAHALRCIFYPSTVMYPLIMRFLLQRPQIDTTDVPMLFASLYSTTDEWRQERRWIIHFIADGMAQSQDWKILTRRHVWDLLSTIFQTSPTDITLRRGILEVLTRLTNNSEAATTLVLRSSLLAWVELQMSELQAQEIEMWLGIISNIVVSVDHAKCDKATLGSWRQSVVACLTSATKFAVATLRRVYTICHIFRSLSETADGGAADNAIICSLVSAVESVEENIMASDTVVEDVVLFQVRHPEARVGHSPLANAPDIWIWGHCVEMLWDVVMHDSRENNGLTGAWDELTSRLVLWNAISGDSGMGEWARRETIRQMKML